MDIASSDPDAQDFHDRLSAFFQGEAPERPASGLSIGVSNEEYHQRKVAENEALLAALDDITGEDTPAPAIDATGAAEPTYERIDDAPAPTPYDTARQRLIDAEILRDVAAPGSDEFHRAMADLAEAKRAVKAEQERATDDGWRKRRATDEWRAGPGRDEYNASRRKVRDRANTMTPKAVLDAMTSEERARHDKDKNAEKVWKHERRKVGWSEERISAELPGWWARRLTKRACT